MNQTSHFPATPEHALKVLVATAKSRKIVAIVIGRSFAYLDHVIGSRLIGEIGPTDLQSYQRYAAIVLTNGSRIIFASPNGLHRTLAGLTPDFVWITTPLASIDHMLISQRTTMLQSAVVLETDPL